MYFCYVDESGDFGAHTHEHPEKSGSSYFIFSGLIVAANKWKNSLDLIKAFRKTIAKQAFLAYDIEFHCSEMIDPHKIKEFTSISVPERWKLIEGYAGALGGSTDFSLISVVIDKTRSDLLAPKYLTTSVTKLYQAFDELVKAKGENGIVFFDRANEKHVNTHVRKLLGTGASGERISEVRIGSIIEDAIFRTSSDSMFIQSADVVAYTLKEKEFPQTSRRKHQAHKIFDRKLSGICFKSKIAEGDGIIRL
jgi:Protein of unknown function (DUF3800)